MEKFDNSFSAGSLSEQKAVYANGKVYVFGKKMMKRLVLNIQKL